MKVCHYKECEVTSLIMKYLEPMIQLLSGTIKEYNMQMKKTKCLNTAIMLTYILGGSDKLKNVEYCEVSRINRRYENKSNKLEYKLSTFNKLKSDLSKKNIRKRYFYYILLTNNNMSRSNVLPKEADKSQFFPGHVFIIDKFPVCRKEKKEAKYNIYQSYIDQYDLKGHYKRNKDSMNLKDNDINYLLDGINNIISMPVWNQKAVNFWNNLTFVDTENLINYKTDNINLCYSKIRIDHCYKQFRNFVRTHKQELELDIRNNNVLNKYQIKLENKFDIFNVKQLSPTDLLNELNNLYNELNVKIKMYE